MGYILPVQQFQYADYQKRVTTEKNDRMIVERPFKAILESQYEEVSEKETVYPSAESAKVRISQAQARALAEMTGLGTSINVNI